MKEEMLQRNVQTITPKARKRRWVSWSIMSKAFIRRTLI